MMVAWKTFFDSDYIERWKKNTRLYLKWTLIKDVLRMTTADVTVV